MSETGSAAGSPRPGAGVFPDSKVLRHLLAGHFLKGHQQDRTVEFRQLAEGAVDPLQFVGSRIVWQAGGGGVFDSFRPGLTTLLSFPVHGGIKGHFPAPGGEFGTGFELGQFLPDGDQHFLNELPGTLSELLFALVSLGHFTT